MIRFTSHDNPPSPSDLYKFVENLSFNRLLGQKARINETILTRFFRASVFEDFQYGEAYAF
jgi:hypothetical protein